MRSTKLPRYCRHSTKDLVYVRLGGRFVYLGKYDSPRASSLTIARSQNG